MMENSPRLPADLDDVTLRRAQGGDMAACEAIYRMYERRAYTLACRICGCPHTAQDVLQDAFVKTFDALDGFSGKVPFWAWFRRIVANTAISQLRKKFPEPVEELDHLDCLSETPGDQIDLQQAFSQLDAEDRTVIWLHDVEGMKHREIAELTGQSESYSKSRLSRSRARLRNILEKPATQSSHQSSTKVWMQT